MRTRPEAFSARPRGHLFAALLGASVIIATLATTTQATPSDSPTDPCAKAIHPAREIVYDDARMKATFTFDIKRCMQPGHSYYLVQAKVYRTKITGEGKPAGSVKICDPKPRCRISVAIEHDSIEVNSEYLFEADYSGRRHQSVVNYIGPYRCTSVMLYQQCSED